MYRRYRFAIVLLSFSVLFAASTLGCSGSGPYPTAQVTTAIGRAGTCEFCHKAIEMVGEENMVAVGSSRFPVCNSSCGARLREKLKNQ
jgi:hypothetical protein